MKNEKGFTLVELLATIIVLGILSGLTLAGVTKYIGKTRQKAYNMLFDTMYEGLSNCISESNCTLADDVNYTSAQLKTKGYIDSFKNPTKTRKNSECTGTVALKVKKTNSTRSGGTLKGNKQITTDESYDRYVYKVDVNCPGIKPKTRYYPNGMSASDWN